MLLNDDEKYLFYGLLISLIAPAQVIAEPRMRHIEEIVVTAEKRTSTVQDTSISMSAISGDSLRSAGISDLMGLSGTIPNLQLNKYGDALVINIRGINSPDITEDGDPAAAFHIDGVFIGRPIAAGQVFYDIDRVEVLRGPQGTLYGRNATAGSINVITNKPSEEFEAALSFNLGNYDLVKSEGMLNLPISDTFQLRTAFSTEDRDGYLKTSNPSAGVRKDANDVQSRAARVRGLLTPTDNLSAIFSFDYAVQGGEGSNAVPLLKGDLSEVNPLNTSGNRDYTFWGASGEVNYHLGWATLTYLGALRRNDTQSATDDDHSTLLSVVKTEDMVVDTLSHEFRLASAVDGPLQWLAGLYYFEEDSDTDTQFLSTPIAGGADVVFLSPVLLKTSRAAYGQATFDFSEALSLTAGLRYTKDEIENESTETWLVAGTDNALLELSNSYEQDWSSTDWKAGLDWQVSDDSLIYLTISTGYKAGGVAGGLTFEPEEILSYEIGSKNQLMDNRMQLNIAAFYYDYTDYQATYLGINPISGGPGVITDNAGKARVQGIELESSLLVGDNGKLDIGMAYLDAVFTDYKIEVFDPSIPGARWADNTGNSLNSAPELTLNLAYQYRWGLDSGSEVLARASIYWQDDYVLAVNEPPPEAFRDSFTRSDATLTYNASNEAWFVQAFVKNIEDEKVANAYKDNAIFGQGTFTNLELLRTYGIRIGARWD